MLNAQDHGLWFMTAQLKTHLSNTANADGLSIVEHRMAFDFAPPRHFHHDEDETFHILQGRFRFQRGDEVRHLVAGETIHLPRGVPHGFRVVSPEGGRCLTITLGGFENMVRDASRPALADTLPEQFEPTLEMQAQLGAICHRHGIDLVGPPIA